MDSESQVEAALDKGALIDTKGPGGQTALMAAALNGHALAIKALLRRGADWSVGENDGYTPMHGAGFQGQAGAARALVEHGLDPRDKHDDGFEPIERACWGSESRHTETVKFFLEEANVPLKGKVFETCRESRNEETRELIKAWWLEHEKGAKKTKKAKKAKKTKSKREVEL